MSRVRFTKARLDALGVIVACDRHGKPAYRSNVTRRPLVYWQTGDWLVHEGYATREWNRAGDQEYRLTDRGREISDFAGRQR